MITFITLYYKKIILFVISLFLLSLSFYIGYNYEKSKFEVYKQEVLQEKNKEMSDFLSKQKEQSIKDQKIVSDLNTKIDDLSYVNEQRKSDLSKLLKENIKLKECSLDKQSLIKLNESITNQSLKKE